MKLPQVSSAAGDSALFRFLNDLTKVLTSELGKRTPDNTTRRNVYLSSPDGSVWEVTVDDAGLVVTTKVSG